MRPSFDPELLNITRSKLQTIERMMPPRFAATVAHLVDSEACAPGWSGDEIAETAVYLYAIDKIAARYDSGEDADIDSDTTLDELLAEPDSTFPEIWHRFNRALKTYAGGTESPEWRAINSCIDDFYGDGESQKYLKSSVFINALVERGHLAEASELITGNACFCLRESAFLLMEVKSAYISQRQFDEAFKVNRIIEGYKPWLAWWHMTFRSLLTYDEVETGMRWLFAEKEDLRAVESECLALLRILFQQSDGVVPPKVERLAAAFVYGEVDQHGWATDDYERFLEHELLDDADNEKIIAVMLKLTQDIIGAARNSGDAGDR